MFHSRLQHHHSAPKSLARVATYVPAEFPTPQPRGGTVCLLLRGGFLDPIARMPATLVLAMTIVLEVIATTSMKLAVKSPIWYIGVFLGYAACFTLFPIALRTLPLSVAYATWSGVGTLASVLIGAGLFSEKLTALKFLWIGLIIAGVVGLNF